jgi:hypothetical protein
MRIHGAEYVAMENELLKWFYHTEANNIPVDSPTVKEGADEITLKVDTGFKCLPVWLQPFKETCNITHKSMSRGLTADVDLAQKSHK